MEEKKESRCKAVYVEITDMCNLRCKHCYNSSGGGKHNHMPMEKLIELIEVFKKEEQPPQLTLSGGEPLCHPQIHEILTYICEQGYPTKVITNGVLAEEALLPYLLKDNSPLSVQLSLDGATTDTDELIRGKGHFDSAVSFLRAAYESGHSRINARMTISRYNIHEIEPFFYLCQSYNALPKYGFISRDGMASVNWDSMSIAESERMQALYKIDLLYRLNSEHWKHREINYSKSATYKCPLMEKTWLESPAIKPNGDVQPCQMLYDKEYTVGNIHSNDFFDIISPENPAIIRLQEFLEHRAKSISSKFCADCQVASICSGGCPAQSRDNGDTCGLDGDCAYRVNAWLSSRIKKMIINKSI